MPQNLTEPASDQAADAGARDSPPDVRTVVADALGLDAAEVAADDDLFELGLDSLTVIRLAGRWRRAGFAVTFEELAEHPTPAQWEDLLARHVHVAGTAAARPVDESGSREFPLAPMQYAYWVGRQDGQPFGGVGSHFYLEFDGHGVDPQRLQAGYARLVARHEMLRVRITGDGRQWIAGGAATSEVTVHDLRGLPAAERAARLEALRERGSHRRFDVEAGEVCEIALSLLPGGATRLHIDLDMMVGDAQSLSVLLADLARYVTDPAAELPALGYDFRRYLADRSATSGEGRERDAAWWRERLADLPGAPELPLRPDAGRSTPRMLRLHHQLDAATTAAIGAAARRHGLTPAAAFATAFAEVVGAWSGSPRFLLNLPLFDREGLHDDVERLVGDFTGSVLLDADTSAARGFALQARDVQTRLHAAVGHSAFTGVDVLRELARRAGEPVLAPVVYTSAIGLGAIDDNSVRAAFGQTVWVSSQNPQVWLDAQVREQGDGLLLNWDARADVLSPDVPEQMFAAYRDLVLRLATVEDAWREPVDALLPAESQRVRARVNATDRPLPHRGLHEAFFAAARRDPERPAVLGEHPLSYGVLAEQALRVAGLLAEYGVRPGATVAITLPRGPDQVLATLGVLAAGATYVPVGVDQPSVRRARILDRADARVVLTDDDHLAVAGSDVALAVPLAAAAAADPLPAPVLVDPSMPAYLLFTSGSTGEPKGVEVPHAAAVNTIASLAARYGIGPDDRSLLVSALDFDLSVFDLFAPLSAGAAVVPLDEDARRDAARWWELVDRHGVTLWNTVPVLLDMLVTAAAGRRRAGPPPLRLVLVGGDRVSPELPGRLHAVAPGCRFLALGGMTEAAIHSTVLEVPAGGPPDPAWSCVPWGAPLDNVRCRVVDARGRDRPDWVTGELWVGGASLARGYRGDPERTADRFVTAEGTRWYRSGDLARYLPDGTLEFLGRTDDQVKVRGHRIELGEIEAALDANPDVSHAVAVVVGDGPSRVSTRLAAAVVLGDGADRDAVLDALPGWQQQRLPAAMVCDRVVVLDRLPLTANGKPDRAAVARALADAAGDERPSEPPRNPVERRLAAVWAALLGAREVGRDDSFFALGGDSLLATELMGRLRAAGLRGGRLGALFAAPRLADFAAVLTLDAASAPVAGAESVVADPNRRHEPFPPTDVQAAYWVGRDPRFTLGGVGTWQYAEFDGENVDLDRMARAWRRLVRRHEMLRAVFDAEGRQRILPEVPAYEISVCDVTAEGPDATAEALAHLRDEHSHRLLDLTRWPLFVLAAVRYRQDGAVRTRLAIGIDYIIFDALSVMTVFTELDRLYSDPDAELPPIEVSFRDYLLQVTPDPQTAERDREHWAARLADLPPPPQLPLRTDPAELVRPRFTRRQRLLAPEAWAALRRRARAEGLTPSTLLLSMYAEVLAAWSAEPALTVTLTLFNRRPSHPHINRVLGDFTSLSPIDHRPTGQGWLSTARELQQRLGADLDHRDVPESWLLRELARRTDALRSAPVVFTSALGVGAGSVSMDMSPQFPQRVWGISQSPQVGLDNQVLESGGGLQVTWDAVEELFCDGVLDTMFDAYGRVLDHLAATADDGDWNGPLPDLLPPAQRETRTRANATAVDLPAGLLHEPFFLRAAEHAGDPALVWEDTPGRARTMTHAELADRALRLAAGLVDRGVQPGDPVGITLPKGPDQIIAVLGVLAAGALYVPVGIDAPPRRRERVHRTAGVREVVTDVDTFSAAQPLAAPIRLAPDAPAYVIFTSGSTGAPKGVQVGHATAANTVADVTARFGVGARDRVLGISALDFDLSVYDMFGLLGVGGAIVLPAEDERRDATRWSELATAHGVTIWNSVPMLLEMLLVAGAPPALRLALVSGDWVPLDLPLRLAAASGGQARLVALGGATEAAIWSNALELDPSGVVPPHWTSVPYGFPLANQCYRVADPDGRDRPDWVPGELWIGGTGVADGYRGDPARTAEKFVEHAGRRWYRTGDLGRYWPDGTLEFLGRADQQVKVGGHRLELGEVEAALGEHPLVERAAVVAVGSHERRRLHAFLITATGSLPPLDAFLAERLAPHAVPARQTVLDTLPLTANGKVDRAALAALAEQETPDATGQAPDGPVETTLAALWAELLDLPEPPGRDAGFFAVGGSSLTALRLVTAVSERFGVDVSIRRFFAEPTVAALAGAIATATATATATAQDEEIGTV